MDVLPIELWYFIFTNKILLKYSQLLYLINKRVYNICKNSRETNIITAVINDNLNIIKWVAPVIVHGLERYVCMLQSMVV